MAALAALPELAGTVSGQVPSSPTRSLVQAAAAAVTLLERRAPAVVLVLQAAAILFRRPRLPGLEMVQAAAAALLHTDSEALVGALEILALSARRALAAEVAAEAQMRLVR